MTTVYTQPKSIVREGKDYRESAEKDRLGRQIGAQVTLWECDFVEEKGARGGYPLAPGHYYNAAPHATRDGKPYGASQRVKRFLTKDERTAWVEAYFAGMAKRAAKAAARSAAK